MIDSGLPPTSEEWPAGVLESLRQWEQGDVVAAPPFFYCADPSRPVWAATRRYGDENSLELIWLQDDEQPRFGMVTTHTCDIAEEGRKYAVRPWVQVAPVFEVRDRGYKKKVLAGGGPRYWLHVPDLGEPGVWAADLRIEMPIEKGWLSKQTRIKGFEDQAARRAVGERLATLRGRPAFSDELNGLVARLHEALHDLDQADGSIAEITVQTDDPLAPTAVQFVLVTKDPIAESAMDWFNEWLDSVRVDLEAAGIALIAPDARTMESISLSEYRRMISIW